MLTVVTGGSASGKSEHAESLITAGENKNRVYIATMRVWDAEGEARVARHRAMRAEKGFTTLECTENLAEADIPRGSAALLECMSNLAANECFGEKGFDGAVERIIAGVRHLAEAAEDTVIVTNEVFSDGVHYDETTEHYLAVLAEVNRRISAMAGRVIEVVCGIPLVWKDVTA